jgi:hypothetical protein
MVELKVGFNNMRIASKGVHSALCNCLCAFCCNSIKDLGGTPEKCHASSRQFFGLIDMWYLVLCPIGESYCTSMERGVGIS